MKRINEKRFTPSWRKKKKKRLSFSFKLPKARISKGAALNAGALASLFLCAYITVFSDYFKVGDIAVAGNDSIPKDKIEAAAKDKLAEKVYKVIPGTSFFFVDENGLKSKIASDFPEIDRVEISRKFPNRIEIAIKEKNPALIWCKQDCFLVNDQGIAFLKANEQDMDSQKKHFIKIMEQQEIPEEKDENPENPTALTNSEKAGSEEIEGEGQQLQNGSEESTATGTEGTVLAESMAAADETGQAAATIMMNDKVSDDTFIKFALDINSRLSHIPEIKVVYYKTKGTKTRELIAFTDKNTRIYFDTTQDAQKQADNLTYVLEKNLEKGQIDSLKYIYLKNNDRVFYK